MLKAAKKVEQIGNELLVFESLALRVILVPQL
jgi:hypothetical protein